MGDRCIVKACEDCWEGTFIPGLANKDNCSGLVKAVAQKLKIPISRGQADAIVDYLSNHSSWRELTSGNEAKIQAETSHLVIAGLKSGDHSPARNNGHVVIVVGGMLYRGSYPKCWSGSTGAAKSQGTKSVGEVWNTRDRENVHYYCYTQGAVCP